MTPEKVLDLTVKFGVVPVLFYVVMLTRSDMEDLKRDLRDCYRERIEDLRPKSAHQQFVHPVPVFAVLPCDPVGKIRKA